jgi:hypothetical protein
MKTIAPATPPATAEKSTYASGSDSMRAVTAEASSHSTGPVSQPQSSKNPRSRVRASSAKGTASTAACTASDFQKSPTFTGRILDSAQMADSTTPRTRPGNQSSRGG